MSESKYFEGQEVWLFENGRKGRKVTVVKVGRKLVQVDSYGRWPAFRIENGSYNGEQRGHGSWIRTDEEVAAEDRRAAVITSLNEHGITHTGYGSFSQPTETLERLLAVLKEDES